MWPARVKVIEDHPHNPAKVAVLPIVARSPDAAMRAYQIGLHTPLVGSAGWVVWGGGSVGLGGGEFVGLAAGAGHGDVAGGGVEGDLPALVVGESVVNLAVVPTTHQNAIVHIRQSTGVPGA
jgi:hypothetical protein